MNHRVHPHAKTWFLAFFIAVCCVVADTPGAGVAVAQEAAPETAAAPPAETPPAEPSPAPDAPAEQTPATDTPPAEAAPPAEPVTTPADAPVDSAEPPPAAMPAEETATPPAETPAPEAAPVNTEPAEPEPPPAEDLPPTTPPESPEGEPAPAPDAAAAMPVDAPPQETMAPVEPDEPMPAPPEVVPAELTSVVLDLERTYPVGRSAFLSISNQFGGIRVNTWDSPIVRVLAKITTSATTHEAAQAFADAIRLEETASELEVRISTVYPEVTEANGPYSVEFDVLAPEDVSLDIKNQLGDIQVAGVNGPVTIDATFGAVDLKNLGNIVRAQAKGKFPFVADGLRRGGIFQLRDAPASFANVSGQLTVTNQLAPVEIRTPGEVVAIDVQAELEDIHLYLPPASHPDIEVVVVDGAIASDVALDPQTQGMTVVGRLVNVDATQRVHLQAAFGTVHIHQDGELVEEAPLPEAPEVVQEAL
ncbi:MAG: hypothetical protein WD873_03450, partial [Candidatus Hydrogenedentales bacterium]